MKLTYCLVTLLMGCAVATPYKGEKDDLSVYQPGRTSRGNLRRVQQDYSHEKPVVEYEPLPDTYEPRDEEYSYPPRKMYSSRRQRLPSRKWSSYEPEYENKLPYRPFKSSRSEYVSETSCDQQQVPQPEAESEIMYDQPLRDSEDSPPPSSTFSRMERIPLKSNSRRVNSKKLFAEEPAPSSRKFFFEEPEETENGEYERAPSPPSRSAKRPAPSCNEDDEGYESGECDCA